MNILINLSTLKKGGGQNVGLNFVHSLSQRNADEFNYFFAVVKDSEIHKALIKLHYAHIFLMPSNPLKRMLRELWIGKSVIKSNKIDIIYSYFGIGLYPRFALQVSGSADSNIYFPEIEFWEGYTGIKKIIKKLIDTYRIWGLKRANAIIFENELMLVRGEEMFHIKKSIYIKPSINTKYEEQELILPKIVQDAKYKGLFFCSWQKNKNYMIIPLIATKLKELNIDFQFVLTAPVDNSEKHLEFLELLKIYNIEEKVSIIGSIKKQEIASLFQQIDIVFLLSKLESFSNNIIEAWHFKKPLVISNELWSKSICRQAAVYVDRINAEDITEKLMLLLNNENYKHQIITNGTLMINTYPNIDERTSQELNYLKYVYETN